MVARQWTDFAKGDHLIAIRPFIRSIPQIWTGSRISAALRARLRHGHCGLNAYLARINKAEPACPACDDLEESVAHFLLYCPAYDSARQTLMQSLSFELPDDDTFLIATLLGTLNSLNASQRTEVIIALDRFIEATKRFNQVTNVSEYSDVA